MAEPDALARPAERESDFTHDTAPAMPSSEVATSVHSDDRPPEGNGHLGARMDKLALHDDMAFFHSKDTLRVGHLVEPSPVHDSEVPNEQSEDSEVVMAHPMPMDPLSSSGIGAPAQRLVGHDAERSKVLASAPPLVSPSPFPPPARSSEVSDGTAGEFERRRSKPPSLPGDLKRAHELWQSEQTEHQSPQMGDVLSSSAFSSSSESGSALDSLTFVDNPVAWQNHRHFPPRLPAATPFSAQHRRSSAAKRVRHWFTHRQKRRSRSFSSYTGSSRASGRSASKSSSSSRSSNGSFNDHVEKLWRQMKKGQQRVMEIKNKMATKRSQLQNSRPKLYSAENLFMNQIRPMLVDKQHVSSSSADVIDKSFAEMERLRTEQQDLEDSYEELEDAMGEEEFHLRRVEVRFYSTLGGNAHDIEAASDSGGYDDKVPANKVPDELRGIPSQRPLEDLDPLFVRLRLAVASLRNGKEELESLQRFKEQCIDTKWHYRDNQQKAFTEASDFLADFPSKEASKKEEIAESEREVYHLKKLCEKRDVMSKHMSSEMMAELYPEKDVEDIILKSNSEILAEHKSLAHPIFSELLSQPDHLIDHPLPLGLDKALEKAKRMPKDNPQRSLKLHQIEKEMSIDTIEKNQHSSGGFDLVNRWLLFRLRISPVEIARLYNTFIARLSIRNVWQWQCDVLRFWYADNTSGTVYHDSNDRSQYYWIAGSRPESRAASEGAAYNGPSRSHHRTYGSVQAW